MNMNENHVIHARNFVVGDVIHNYPASPAPERREDDVVRRNLVTLLNSNREESLQVRVPGVNRVNVPEKNPVMNQILFYTGEAQPENEEYNPRSRPTLASLGPLLSHELFSEREGRVPRFVAVLGEAGAGKSTISRRLCDATDKIILHANFMNMDYTDKVTIAEILLSKRYNCDVVATEEYFDWIERHQQECRLILDGYDQASWQNLKNPPGMNPNERCHIDVIIGNLFSGGILPKMELLVTSRPHAMLSLPVDLQPDRVAMLNGFSPGDAEELFVHFVGEARADQWQRLQRRAPQLPFMCANPAMLVYISAACCEGASDVTSITSVLQKVLRGVRRSIGRSTIPVDVLMSKVEVIAFAATRRGTVLITERNLKDVELQIPDVQDITIVLPAAFHDVALFDGEFKLYFNHQTLQEYFSSKYSVGEQTDLATFKQFVKNDLFEFHWTMVRRFAAALLINSAFNEDSKAVRQTIRPRWRRTLSRVSQRIRITNVCENLEKRICFLKKFLRTFAETGNGLNTGDTQDKKKKRQLFMDLLLDVRECDNDDVTRAVADRFPSQVILEQMPFTASEAHAFAFVLRHVTKRIDYMDLRYCNLTTHQFELICSGITNMDAMVDDVNFHNNSLDTDGARVVASILPKVGRFFRMGDAFIEAGGTRRNVNEDERAVIQEALDHVQNPRLAVCVGGPRDVMQAHSPR